MTILQQTTLNMFCQKIENLYNWIDNLWLKVENIVAKGEIACFVQFLLLSLCFQIAICCRNLYNWMDNLRPKVENIVSLGEIAHFEQFLLLSLYFQEDVPLQRRPKASIWGKGLKRHSQNKVLPLSICVTCFRQSEI